MPLINTSEAKKRSSDRTENGNCKNITNRRIEFVKASQPHFTLKCRQTHKITRSSFKQIKIEKYITPLASSILTNRSRAWPVNHFHHQKTPPIFEKTNSNFRKTNSYFRKANSHFRKTNSYVRKTNSHFRKTNSHFPKTNSHFRKKTKFSKKQTSVFEKQTPILVKQTRIFVKQTPIFEKANS